ncbi:MAG: PadR family transcriptional regulator [Candidatus Bathyarchaeota archaeon]|nr:PadR family transcriptional regulator [Candidatus Bathyarchaeota archaeon]
MKPKTTEDLRARTIKTYSDILILKYLNHQPQSSGYDILKHFYGAHNLVFSPGTIYHEIYKLERQKLITSDGDESGRMYSLTSDGSRALAAAVGEKKHIQELISAIFSEN